MLHYFIALKRVVISAIKQKPKHQATLRYICKHNTRIKITQLKDHELEVWEPK